MPARRILYAEQNTDGTVGGSYYSLLDIARTIDRDRYEPVVLFHRNNPLFPRFDAICRTIIRPPGVRIRDITARARLLRREGIDLVHLNNDVGEVAGWLLAARVAGIPCISHQRGIARLSRSRLFFARRLDAVVAIARFLADDLAAKGIDPGLVTTIHNGIDPAAVRAAARRDRDDMRASLGIDPERLLVGMVGNIKPWKGQLVLARAMRAVAGRVPAAACLFLGGVSPERPEDEAYLAEVRAAVGEAGLADQTVFAGFRDDPFDVMRSLDLLVHASVEPEPLGRVILEGMALGTPVVAAAAGGPLEIVEDGVSGMLTPPGDEEALAEAIVSLLLDPGLRREMAGRARRRIEERFLLVDRIADLERLYARLLPAPA